MGEKLRMNSPRLSVVVPAHNEAPNLRPLLAAVAAALAPLDFAWELIVVDDGSRDETRTILAQLVAADARLRAVHLPEQSGQTAALAAGFAAAQGELIATLDADMQCAPADLVPLLHALGDADLACGIRTRRHDPLTRRLASALSNVVRRALLAPRVRDLACPLRVFRRAALARVQTLTPLFYGAHRWLPALFWIAGLRIVQYAVPHHARLAGESKYTTRGRVRPIAREMATMLDLVLRHRRELRWIVSTATLALIAVPFFYHLGYWPLMEPDEGRNAEVGREMLLLGNWVLPHFNLLPYLDKPVLLFWGIAAAFRLFGVNEAAARLPAALGGVGIVVFTFAIARELVDIRRALLAAVIVGTAPLVFVFSRLTIFDPLLTTFMLGAVLCIMRAQYRPHPTAWCAGAGACMALATLTKGPVGIAVPLLAWYAGRGALPHTRRCGWRSVTVGALVLLTIVAPWMISVTAQEPAFLRYALLDETLLRLTSSARFHRGAPTYFYLGVLLWGLGVWAVVFGATLPRLVRSWRASASDAAAIAFLMRAALATLVFFSLSASKRPQYILPAVALLAILLAVAMPLAPARTADGMRASARALLLLGTTLAVAGYLQVVPAAGEFSALTPLVLCTAGLYLVAWSLAVLALGSGLGRMTVAAALFTPLLGASLLHPLLEYAEGRSSRRLATHIDPAARVICYRTFRTALPFYLGRPVALASDDAHELTSNYVASQEQVLRNRSSLLPASGAAESLAGAGKVDAIANTWNIHALTEQSARRLYLVYADHNSVVVRAGS